MKRYEKKILGAPRPEADAPRQSTSPRLRCKSALVCITSHIIALLQLFVAMFQSYEERAFEQPEQSLRSLVVGKLAGVIEPSELNDVSCRTFVFSKDCPCKRTDLAQLPIVQNDRYLLNMLKMRIKERDDELILRRADRSSYNAIRRRLQYTVLRVRAQSSAAISASSLNQLNLIDGILSSHLASQKTRFHMVFNVIGSDGGK